MGAAKRVEVALLRRGRFRREGWELTVRHVELELWAHEIHT